MKQFPKIDTLFNRGPDFTVLTDELRHPEFGAVDRWIFTEKIDGTNIRVDFRLVEPGTITTREVGGATIMTIGGRTDNAQLPKPLEALLKSREALWRAVAESVLHSHNIRSLTLFGEGYGPKIQKGGGRYGDEQDFILFDVLVNDSTWLGEEQITETALRFGLMRVGTLWVGTRADAVEMVTERYSSRIKYFSMLADNNGKPVDFEIEGVVARPLVPLYDGRGRRVCWKLKSSDFRAGRH